MSYRTTKTYDVEVIEHVRTIVTVQATSAEDARQQVHKRRAR